ncbi:hypothetical protein [Paenibacillus athensensis]|nr:hypothetical protein [Paenibacillus athensensis]
MANFHQALQHKNRLSPVLLKRAGVMAVGVGYADPGKPASGACVIVYTKKNIAAAEITSLKLAVTRATGAGANVPMRFVSTGTFHGHAGPKAQSGAKPAVYGKRVRPVPGGVSIGKPDPAATGTAGLIVIKNNQLYILSNNHVLIKNNSTAYSETLQPGPADGGRTVIDRVGRAYEFVRLRKDIANVVDAAIALPLSNSTLNPRYVINRNGALITVPGHLLSYRVGELFMKFGRTTEYVTGIVESNNVDVRVDYGGSLGVLLFRNQSVIRGTVPVSLPGDSGSVWLRASDRYAAALNFAGTADGLRSISNPIASVMSIFGLRVAIPAADGKFAAGAVKGAAPQGNHAYVQPLTARQRARLRAIRVRASR